MTKNKPVVLLILDGWGDLPHDESNAITCAHTPIWDGLLKNAPHILLSSSGEDVGLPDGQMGNSEVGHLTMGAGRVIYQDLTRINKSIREGDFFQNPVLKDAFAIAKSTDKAVHLLCLLSPGGVHSHEDHLFACMQMAKQNGVSRIFVHVFLDGRDTPPQSARTSLEKLQHQLEQTGAILASVCGRYYAMDRDKRWERTQLAYLAIWEGKAPFYAKSGLDALDQAYLRQETDEFVKPTVIMHPEKGAIQPHDIVIFMNFRSDRARQLAHALTDPDFKEFDRSNDPLLGDFVTLTEYDKNIIANVAFKKQIHTNVLGEYLQNLHLTQLHLAETEKYAHVTFFFNGGIEPPFKGEKRILVPSPKIATYDLQPQMSAPEITKALVDNILHEQFDFIVCNYANADMLGHTGDFQATVKAIETLDLCLGQIIQAIETKGGQMLITSDHGNAECMIDSVNKMPHTAHTTSLVPLVYVGKQKFIFKSNHGKLSDVAPTLLHLMALEQPAEMTGHSLLQSRSDSFAD